MDEHASEEGAVNVTRDALKRLQRPSEQQIEAALDASGMRRPAKQATQTPNCASDTALDQVNKVAAMVSGPRISYAVSQMEENLSFLLCLTQQLIFERGMLEDEIAAWRKKCDELMVDAIYRILGSRPTFRG